jgi:hypothetical protein
MVTTVIGSFGRRNTQIPCAFVTAITESPGSVSYYTHTGYHPKGRRFQMRKTGLFAVAAAALILAGIGEWGASNTQAARVATATSIGINPFQMMTNARHLDTELYQDFSLVFH